MTATKVSLSASRPAPFRLCLRRRQFRVLLVSVAIGVFLSGAAGALAADGHGLRPPEIAKFPLLWAEGVAAADFGAYRRLGFNCVLLSAKADYEDADWEGLDNAFDAAEKEGLWVVVELESSLASAPSGPGARTSPYDDSYLRSLRDWTTHTLLRYKARPNLLGWSAESGLEELVSFSEQDFTSFLASTAASGPLGYGPAPGIVETGGLMPDRKAMLDALYRFSAVRGVMQAQADFILQADGSHFLFSGQQQSFRSIAAVPQAYDFVISAVDRVPAATPSSVQPRPFALSALGLHLARGPGTRSGALAFLQIDAATPPQYLSARVKQAFLHGASGVGLSNWAPLRDSVPLQRAFRAALAEVQEQGLVGFRPQARTAVIYSPFPGCQTGVGAPDADNPTAQATQASSPFGYIAGWQWGEPADLLLAFASGTRFGTIDYVTEDDLSRLPLDRYRVILAPSALFISSTAANWLKDFVGQGGILVADLGFGAYQSGSFNRLPVGLDRTLFGITGLRVTRGGGCNLVFVSTEAFAPSLSAANATGWQGQPAFIGPVAEAFISPSTRPWALLRPLPPSLTPMTKAGLLVHPWGKGVAIFSTLHLWSQWPRLANSDAAFQKFHGDLLGPPAWAEAVSESFLPQGCEFLSSPTELAALNLSQEDRTIRIRLAPPIGYLFAGGVENLLGQQGRPHELEATLGRGQLLRLAGTSITADANAPVAIAIEKLTAKRIVLLVSPLGVTSPVSLSLAFRDGEYRVLPRSRHTLSLELNGQRQTRLLRADEKGRLDFRGQAGAGEIILEPLARPAPTSETNSSPLPRPPATTE